MTTGYDMSRSVCNVLIKIRILWRVSSKCSSKCDDVVVREFRITVVFRRWFFNDYTHDFWFFIGRVNRLDMRECSDFICVSITIDMIIKCWILTLGRCWNSQRCIDEYFLQKWTVDLPIFISVGVIRWNNLNNINSIRGYRKYKFSNLLVGTEFWRWDDAEIHQHLID